MWIFSSTWSAVLSSPGYVENLSLKYEYISAPFAVDTWFWVIACTIIVYPTPCACGSTKYYFGPVLGFIDFSSLVRIYLTKPFLEQSLVWFEKLPGQFSSCFGVCNYANNLNGLCRPNRVWLCELKHIVYQFGVWHCIERRNNAFFLLQRLRILVFTTLK